jgi:hypothetical protein
VDCPLALIVPCKFALVLLLEVAALVVTVGAAMVAVASIAYDEAVPELLVAATKPNRYEDRSLGWGVYIFDVAPEITVQPLAGVDELVAQSIHS